MDRVPGSDKTPFTHSNRLHLRIDFEIFSTHAEIFTDLVHLNITTKMFQELVISYTRATLTDPILPVEKIMHLFREIVVPFQDYVPTYEQCVTDN
jgi:hypothetical protein